jgi:hypothetical protein
VPPDGGQDKEQLGGLFAQVEQTMSLLATAKRALCIKYGVEPTGAKLRLHDFTVAGPARVPITGINAEDCRQQMRQMIERLQFDFFLNYGVTLANGDRASVTTPLYGGLVFTGIVNGPNTPMPKPMSTFDTFAEAAEWLIKQLTDDSPGWTIIEQP